MQQHPPATVGQLMDKASLSSSDVVDSEKNANFAGSSEPIDHAAEKKLVWKLDLYMMPLLFYLYMLCFLDRTNIGNARVAGLERSIGLTGYQYNIGLSVFYIFYAGIEVPSNMVLRWIGAQKWIPTIIVAFGLVTTCTAFIKNFADFMVVRVFLGIAEGGLMPAYLLVLSRFYSRREVVFRTALFASSATIAGMFGGLLAYGFLQVDIPFLEDRWRNIFFLEGIITLGSGLLAFFAISNAPGTAKFLTPEERIVAERRIRRENIGTKVLIEAAKKEIFFRAFRNPNTLLCALGFGLSSLSLQGLALFIPTIIRGIDPTFTTVEIQLKTVPVYAVAFVIAISGSLLCMRYDRRAYTIILVNIFAVVGFAMFLGTETRQTKVRYGALFLCAMGIYTPGPIWLSWGIGNAGLDQERAVAAGLLVGLGTMGSVVASWSFLPTDAPRYKIGNSLNLSVVLASQALAVFLMFYNRRENTKRAQGASNHLVEGRTEEEIATLGHKHPEFVYKW